MAEIAPDFRLDGRVAFISGAAGHLGASIAQAFDRAGARLILNGRNEARLKELAKTLRCAECAAFDVSDFAAVRTFFTNRERIDVIVNNAISMTPKPRDTLAPEDFDLAYRSSVTAAFEIVRAALPGLRNAVKAAHDASVINIASMYGAVSPDARIYARPEQASPFHYGPAKAALIQLTRHLAAELGPERIRANALVPGPFPRPAVRSDDPQFAERLAARTMLRRLGDADEIAGPVQFLASAASSFVTGATLAVDGGWTAW
jgi:NAD(P)-dependent dehydrogenase (short-subunit alcohol dehydrogenase family)